MANNKTNEPYLQNLNYSLGKDCRLVSSINNSNYALDFNSTEIITKLFLGFNPEFIIKLQNNVNLKSLIFDYNNEIIGK